MHQTKQIILILFLLFIGKAFSQNPDDLIGKYRLPNKLDVEIYKENGKYFGKIIALRNFDDGQTTDVKNPDKSKQNIPLIGLQIIRNLEYDEQENKWLHGQMYGPEKGMNFNLKVTEVKDKEITVVGSKYFFWRTLIWEKVE